MHPKLGEWAGIPFYAYGTCLVLAAPVCLAVLAALLRRRDCNRAAAVDVSTLALIGYWLGARLLYALVSGRAASLSFSEGTPGAWGGQIAFGVLGALYFATTREPVAPLADALAVGWAALTVPVKIGCFLAGCCYGAPTSLPWGVRFPADGYCSTPGVAIHPTQLYDAGAALVLAVVLGSAFLRRAGEGRLLLWFGLLYSVTKFSSELVRGDRRFPVAGVLTASTLVEAAVAFGCLVLLAFPSLWRGMLGRLDRTPPRETAEAGVAGKVFLLELIVAAVAFLAAAGLGAGRVWPLRALAAYGAVVLAAQPFFARGIGGLRLVDPSGGRPSPGRLLARGLVQALAAFTLLQLLRPLFDRAARTAGDAAAECRFAPFPAAGEGRAPRPR